MKEALTEILDLIILSREIDTLRNEQAALVKLQKYEEAANIRTKVNKLAAQLTTTEKLKELREALNK